MQLKRQKDPQIQLSSIVLKVYATFRGDPWARDPLNTAFLIVSRKGVQVIDTAKDIIKPFEQLPHPYAYSTNSAFFTNTYAIC